MTVGERFTTLVVEASNLINTGNLAALLGLLLMLAFLADQVWKRSPRIKSWSFRAGIAAFAVYLSLMIANFGQFDAGFLVGILWRGLLAGALFTGMASVLMGIAATLLADPARWFRRQIDDAVDAARRRRDDCRRRAADIASAAVAAERDRLLAPDREQARRAAADAARRREGLVHKRDRLRFDLRLEFNKIRKLDHEILTNDEFESQLDHALAPDDPPEIDRRVAALRDVFTAVLSKVPKIHTFESLAQDFVERHAAIDRSVFDDDIKLKLHRWVNLQGEHEVQQLRHRQSQ